MKGKHLFLILALTISTTAVIALCGCSNAVAPASGAASDPAASSDNGLQTAAVSAQQPANVQTPVAEPAAANSASGEIVQTAAKKKKTTVTNPEAPWEDFNMRGIPEVLDRLKKDDGDLFVLVNKLHAVSKNYKPTDMVVMDNKLTTWQNLEMKSDAYDAYLKLYRAAKKKGFSLKVCSAYRTYSTQKTLYANAVKTKGRKTANIRSARAGRSEHHTGYAIDITSKSMGWGLKQDFADYPDGKWINDHCHEYGFIIRYPKGKTDITGYAYEPWHLRYVGVEAATEIMEQGITLEEYLGR